MVILETSKLSKTYGSGSGAVNAINNVNITIEESEFVGIIGKSGGGKTTLLKMLGSMMPPTGGDIYFETSNLVKMKPEQLADLRRKKMGFLFQDFKLLPSLNVKENIALPLLLEGADVGTVNQRVNELLQTFDIEGIAYKKINEISGGQCQKTALCRALANHPTILFADEPTGNLDTVSTKAVMQCLKETNDVLKMTIVMVTHDYEIASQCHKVYVIKDGCVKRLLNRKEYSGNNFEKEVIEEMNYL